MPAGTPDAAAAKLESALKLVATDPKVQARLLEIGNPASFKSAAEFKSVIADDTARYANLVKQQNIKNEIAPRIKETSK